MSDIEPASNPLKRERSEDDEVPVDDGTEAQQGPATKKAKALDSAPKPKRDVPPFTYRPGIIAREGNVDGETVMLKPRLVRHQYEVGKPIVMMGTQQGDKTDPFLFETPPVEILTVEPRTDQSKKYPAEGIGNAAFWAMFNVGPLSDEYITHAQFPHQGKLVSYPNPAEADEVRMANKNFGMALLARCGKAVNAWIKKNGTPEGVKKRVKKDQKFMINMLKKDKSNKEEYDEMVANIKRECVAKVLRFPVKGHTPRKEGDPPKKKDEDGEDDDEVDLEDPKTVLSLTVSTPLFNLPDGLFSQMEGADENAKKAIRKALNETTPDKVKEWIAAHEKFSKLPIGELMALYPMDGAETPERWYEELAKLPYIAVMVNGCKPRMPRVYGPWGQQRINMIEGLPHICHVDYYYTRVGAPPVPTWIPERGDLWKFKFEIVAREQKKDSEEATFALKARLKEANVIRKAGNLYGDKFRRSHGDDYGDAEGWNMEDLFGFQAETIGEAPSGASSSSSSSGPVPMDEYPTS